MLIQRVFWHLNKITQPAFQSHAHEQPNNDYNVELFEESSATCRSNESSSADNFMTEVSDKNTQVVGT